MAPELGHRGPIGRGLDGDERQGVRIQLVLAQRLHPFVGLRLRAGDQDAERRHSVHGLQRGQPVFAGLGLQLGGDLTAQGVGFVGRVRATTGGRLDEEGLLWVA